MADQMAGLFTTYLLYAMAAVPFAVWTGRSTYGAIRTSEARQAGTGRLVWFVVLPFVLIAYGLLRGYDVRDAADPFADDEWGQMLFLFAAPCAGMIAGYAIGWTFARR